MTAALVLMLGITCEVLSPVEGWEPLDEVNSLLSNIHPRKHVQDSTHQLPGPGHRTLIPAKLPSLLFQLLATSTSLRSLHHNLQ